MTYLSTIWWNFYVCWSNWNFIGVTKPKISLVGIDRSSMFSMQSQYFVAAAADLVKDTQSEMV